MTKIVFQNSKILTLSGNWIIPVPGVGPEPQYTITIGTSTHGSVSASALSATAGTTITLTATPDTDYQLDYFTLNGIAIVGNSFVMPSENVTVSAVFVAAGPSIPSVTIGSQTWMSKNLDINDGQGGIYTQTVNYGQGDVVEYYYTWDAAVRVAASISGWHLPTQAECNTLISAAGGGYNAGTKLRSTYGWNASNGTDNYGFAAFPAGLYDRGFMNQGNYAFFWISNNYSTAVGYAMFFDGYGSASTDMENYKTAGFSVRLIKDAT